MTFAYTEGTPILHDITLEVRPGETAALVGPTGAGKSTLLALIPRLMDPTRGSVLVGGVDVRTHDLEGLRRRIALVPQDVFLFRGSVLDNVRLFDTAISEERVRAALAAVGALPFVEALAGGVHAALEERGATLSHGERQLLSFARALAWDPDVLLLDEATAAIDSRSEAVIQDALRTLRRHRTCLVVAHRLSTVRDADRIFVLEAGEVRETGTHDELMRQGGSYARMVRSA